LAIRSWPNSCGRKGVVDGDLYVAHMRELFRRMVFNILIDNTDDHEKNHALLVTDSQQYALSPAYDVLPSGSGARFQQMRVGDQEADATMVNALSLSRMFSLTKDEASTKVRPCRHRRWLEGAFRSYGVTAV